MMEMIVVRIGAGFFERIRDGLHEWLPGVEVLKVTTRTATLRGTRADFETMADDASYKRAGCWDGPLSERWAAAAAERRLRAALGQVCR